MNRQEACQKLHEVAVTELGVHETPGTAATARIVEYDSHTTMKATSDEVPWCSSAANFVTDTAGFPGTHSAAALSWLGWGQVLTYPILGCIVVMDRHDAMNPQAAHVTFCDSEDISNGIIRCIGGNQHDSFSVARFHVEKVLGYRSPI
jgi:uncharacterized protein (TIGR02594 family)